MRPMMLRDIQDENGRRQQSASLQIDGTLLIEGHDLGRGVESFFGSGQFEYEWALKILSPGVEKLKLALSCDDLMVALKDRFSGNASADLQAFLDDNAVPYEFWSRVGD